jgi:DNA-binding transcriptional LysR family regulator
MTAGFVPAILDRVSRHSPHIVVHVVNAQTVEQEFRELRERRVDLMMGVLLRPLANDDVNMEVLCRDKHVVAGGTSSQWARRRKIELSELMNEPWILFPSEALVTSYLAKAIGAKGWEMPRASVTSFSFHVRMQLLSTGRFLTIMLGSVLRHNAERWSLKALPVDLGTSPVPVSLFTLKNRTLSPVVEHLIGHMREVATSMAKVR